MYGNYRRIPRFCPRNTGAYRIVRTYVHTAAAAMRGHVLEKERYITGCPLRFALRPPININTTASSSPCVESLTSSHNIPSGRLARFAFAFASPNRTFTFALWIVLTDVSSPYSLHSYKYRLHRVSSCSRDCGSPSRYYCCVSRSQSNAEENCKILQ